MLASDRALLVHHSEGSLTQICAALSGQLPVDMARSSEEALGRLKATSYSVVVLDHAPPSADAEGVLRATIAEYPEAMVIVMTPELEVARGFEELSPGKVHRFLGGADRRWELGGIVAQGLRLARLEREQRELVRKLGGEYAKLQRREKLLDQVVRERTRELETAYSNLKAANRQLLLGIAVVIEAKDAYTEGHCGRVAGYALGLARAIGYPEADMERLEYSSYLHDIGKIAVSDAVLKKPAALDDAEWKHMRTHPVVGDQIASKIELLRPFRDAIRNHHERWDGDGYPDRMRGDQIPLDARIVCIADAWDAMITDRPYKVALPLSDCYGFLRKGQGKQFDPNLIDAFIKHKVGEE